MSVNTQRNRPMIADPNIIPRVRKYLEEHVDQTYVDVGVMAKELQEKYTEYTRRKTVPFRILVEQAYKLVLRSYGLDSNPSSDNEEGSDVELMEENQGKSNNHMNDTMSSLYMNKPKSTIIANNDGELIDISSDDDDDEAATQKPAPVNKENGTDRISNKEDHSQYKSTTLSKLLVNKPEKPQLSIPTQSLEEITITPNLPQAPVNLSSGKKSASPNEVSQAAKKRKTDENMPLPVVPTAVSITSVRSNTPQPTPVVPPPTTYAALSAASKPKRFKKEVKCINVSTTFDDIGGMDKTLTELCELLVHVKHPAIYRTIGLPPPRGFLLHGPPGCGKTLLAHSIAGTLDIPLINIPATELVAGVSGESEERIREVFEQAAALAPCVLFIDEIDVISSNRNNASKDMERRIVSQLLGSMDGLGDHPNGGGVIVIGATNRPDSLDPALRRVGRFDHEICLGIPDRKARFQILHMICYDLKLEHPFDYDKLAALTPGYVGADLLALAQRAASTAIKRVFTQKEEHEAEAQAKRKLLLNKAAANRLAGASISEVVNLTDDTIIMDVDDEEVTSSEKPKVVEEEKVVVEPLVNGEVKAEEKSVVETTTAVAVEEPVATENGENGDEQKITTTTAVEVNGDSKVDVDSVLPSIPTITTTTAEVAVEQMDTSDADAATPVVEDGAPATVEATDGDAVSAESEKVPEEEKTAETTTPTEEATPPTPTATETETETEPSTEKEEEKIQEPKLENEPEQPAEAEEKPAEQPTETPAPVVETPVTEEDVTMVEAEKSEILNSDTTTTTTVAIVAPPIVKAKTTLSLECMMQWLMNDVPVLTDEELKSLYITMDDFVEALKYVQPSAKREGFITIPDVTWKDIGSLQDIRDELKLAVLAPVRFPDKLEKLGLTSPSGVLLCGPPGCGKTLLAKAIANEAGINFISVKGPELLNMYVGESERAVRQVFQRARNSTPCVIFFDEFDALCPKRSDTSDGGGSQRVVNQLLTEMDGIEERKGVFLMAATNRPDIVDPAVLRPGRLDKILYVGLPDEHDRADILRAVTKDGKKPPIADDVDMDELAAVTSGFTGADLAGLIRQAALQSLKSSITGVVDVDEEDLVVKKEHILEALANVKPSVSDEDIKHYEKLKKKYGTTKKV